MHSGRTQLIPSAVHERSRMSPERGTEEKMRVQEINPISVAREYAVAEVAHERIPRYL